MAQLFRTFGKDKFSAQTQLKHSVQRSIRGGWDAAQGAAAAAAPGLSFPDVPTPLAVQPKSRSSTPTS